MILPLFSMIIPFLLTAMSIRFGKDGDGIDHQCMQFQQLLFHKFVNK